MPILHDYLTNFDGLFYNVPMNIFMCSSVYRLRLIEGRDS